MAQLRWTRGWRRHLRRMIVPCLIGLALGLLARRWLGGDETLGFEPRSVEWEPLSPLKGAQSAVVPVRVAGLGPGPGGKADLYLGWARFTHSGRLISLDHVVNVSRSPSTHEREILAGGARLAFAAAQGEAGEVTSIEVLQLAEAAGRGEGDWSLGQRAAAALSSHQLWGQPWEPRRLRVDLHHPAGHVELGWRGGELRALTPRGELRVDLAAGALTRGRELADLVEPEQARPALFSWAVDQVRYSRLVGPERLQVLEQYYLEAVDAYVGIAEERAGAGEAEPLPRQLGRLAPRSAVHERWPPPALDPLLDEPLENEGQWIERDRAFVTQPDGVPPLLYTTFIRTEPERPRSSRVYLTVWDPAWLDLGWVAGTTEPRSTHGHTGTGRVPREDLERLVAGFNGGFQAVDGAFGMRTRTGPFLPPVPYGATVARLPDGRIGLGTWPNQDLGEDAPPLFRQNLTALIEDGEVNPYERRFWGGVPAELRDTTRTDRTGLCLTEEHHMAYFWGKRVTVSGLVRAMEAARCRYGMLLDINFSNTVFETYRIARPGELPPVDRPLEPEWEREGRVEGRDDLVYRVQAMAPGMTRVGFPRYIRTELRDFFYLTIRSEALVPPLPDLCDLAPASEPVHAPPAAWRCSMELDPQGPQELFELDARRLRFTLAPAGSAAGAWLAWPVDGTNEDGGVAIRFRSAPGIGSRTELVEVGAAVDPSEGVLIWGWDLASGRAPAGEPAAAGVVIAVGSGGALALAGASWASAHALWPRFEGAGFSRAIYVPRGDRLLVVEPDPRPLAVRIFQETEPAPRRVWGPIHREAQRRIDEQGLTRHYVNIRDYLERDR